MCDGSCPPPMLMQAPPNINSACCGHQARGSPHIVSDVNNKSSGSHFGVYQAAPGPEQRRRTISLLAGVPGHARRFVQRRCWVRNAKQQPILVVQCRNGGRSAQIFITTSQAARQPARWGRLDRRTNGLIVFYLSDQQPWWRCRCHVTAARGNGPFRST